MDDSFLWQILLQIILIALNAVFACAEIAVISTSETKLIALEDAGDKKAKRLLWLKRQPARFLATIQVAITLSGFLGSAFAADHFSDQLTAFLLNLGVPIPEKTLDAIAVVLITIVLSYFTLVLGELVPKRLAMKKAEQIASALSTLIVLLSKALTPIVFILTKSTNGILTLLGVNPEEEEEAVTEEEIRSMLDLGSQHGTIDRQENEIIQNVFEFDDIEVSEFLTHRTDLCLLDVEETVEEWGALIHESRHSHYPICEETADHIVGVLDAKDFFRLQSQGKEVLMAQAVKPAFFVPENLKANVLFRQMQESKRHFAIVLDEYGGTVGIVTINDLLEQLVGVLENESSDPDEPFFEETGDGVYRISGNYPLSDFTEQLNLTNMEEEEEDCDTFGGLVFKHYGSVPDDGTRFEIDIGSFHVKVDEIKDHRIEKATVTLKDPSAAAL